MYDTKSQTSVGLEWPNASYCCAGNATSFRACTPFFKAKPTSTSNRLIKLLVHSLLVLAIPTLFLVTQVKSNIWYFWMWEHMTFASSSYNAVLGAWRPITSTVTCGMSLALYKLQPDWLGASFGWHRGQQGSGGKVSKSWGWAGQKMPTRTLH